MKGAAAVSKIKRLALCRWLAAMESDHDSRPGFRDPHRTRSPETIQRKSVAAFDESVNVGDVRLFSPVLTPDVDRPVYFAVLAAWDQHTFAVAPFSPYEEAATDSELVVGTAAQLRVLCLWNTRTIAKKLVAESWLVDCMTIVHQREAWAVFRHAMVGTSLPKRLEKRVGVPVYQAGDPRVAYQLEEAEGLQFLVEESEKVLQG
jgi:hypothetical protein